MPTTEHEFTTRHCAAWCEAVGIDPDHIPAMVAYLEDDGPESTMSWPTVARMIGATFYDGTPYDRSSAA